MYKSMRIERALLILIFFYSCHSFRDNDSFIPLEYTFPENEINNGKTYTYVDESNGEKTYYDYYLEITMARNASLPKSIHLMELVIQ